MLIVRIFKRIFAFLTCRNCKRNIQKKNNKIKSDKPNSKKIFESEVSEFLDDESNYSNSSISENINQTNKGEKKITNCQKSPSLLSFHATEKIPNERKFDEKTDDILTFYTSKQFGYENNQMKSQKNKKRKSTLYSSNSINKRQPFKKNTENIENSESSSSVVSPNSSEDFRPHKQILFEKKDNYSEIIEHYKNDNNEIVEKMKDYLKSSQKKRKKKNKTKT